LHRFGCTKSPCQVRQIC